MTKPWNNVGELYNDAIVFNESSILLLLDFLIFEKDTVKMEDPISTLELYFKPNNRSKMNRLLDEYKTSLGVK